MSHHDGIHEAPARWYAAAGIHSTLRCESITRPDVVMPFPVVLPQYCWCVVMVRLPVVQQPNETELLPEFEQP